jgi:hypothetical protein
MPDCPAPDLEAGTLECMTCHEVKSLDAFFPSRFWAEGYWPYCKGCMAEDDVNPADVEILENA